MISLAAQVTNLVFRLIPPSVTGDQNEIIKERDKNKKISSPKLPKGMTLEEFDLNDHVAEKIKKEGNHKGLIFYIHGGGFTTGDSRERRIFTYYAVDHYGYDCISINYSLAPENKWPSQIEDCFTAYQNVLRMDYRPEDIVLAGESAGGCLVLSLALLLKERGVSQPKAILAFSPATDNYADLTSHTANIKTDYMLKDAVSKGIADVLFEKVEDREILKDPLISPYYGNYEGLPPIFISVSDFETLYDDSIVLYEKLKKEGHKVELDVGHGLCHAYQIMHYMPEAKRSLNKAFAFADNI